MKAPTQETLTLLEIGDLVFRYGFVTLASIAFVVLIHEFGHYLAARAFGIRVTKFSIGFGREIWGRTDKKGTRWALSRIPIGGYVSIFGDVDPGNPVIWDSRQNCARTLSPEELTDAFCTRKVWQRMIVVAAGPAINMLLALSLMAGIFVFRGVQVIPPVIRGLAVGTASYDAGFKLDDRILEMDGRKIKDFQDVYEITTEDWTNPHEYKVLRDGQEIMITMTSREINHTDFKGRKWTERGRTGMVNGVSTHFEEFISVNGIDTRDDPGKARDIIRKNLDQVIQVEYELTDENRDIFITRYPASLNKHLNDPESPHYDRVFLSDYKQVEYTRLDPLSACARAIEQIYNGFKRTAGLIYVLHKGRTEQPGLGGVIKVGEFAGGSVKEGWPDYIRFLAILSIAIAAINILPIPLLDGGFMVFLIYEAVTGKRISPRAQNLAFAIALVFLAGIMIIANTVDLIYLFS